MSNYTNMSNEQVDQIMNDMLEQRANNAFTLEDHELAGIGMGGTRLPDGKIQISGSGKLIPDWPSEVTLLGDTFTLESVQKGSNGWENAEYV